LAARLGPTVEHLPIQFVFNTHGHSFQLDEPAAFDTDWYDSLDGRYSRQREQFDWLIDEAESRGGRMSMQLNGEYARHARLAGDAAHVNDADAAGHAMGAHFHTDYFTGAHEFWDELVGDEQTPAGLAEVWSTHLEEIELLLGHEPTRIDAAVPLQTHNDWRSYEYELARADACAVGAGETFAGVLEYNHNPFTPYRRAAFSEHIEDFDGLTLAIPSYPQVGIDAPRGAHRLFTTVPQLQRQFLMILANRHYEQSIDAPVRVWTMGVMTHLDSNGGAQDDVRSWLDFLTDIYRDTTDDDGSRSVEWTTDEELIATFEAWEADHPDESAFDFDVHAHEAGDAQPYPYALEPLARALVGADYAEELDLGPGVVAWRLEHRELWVDGYDRFGNPNLVLDPTTGDLILAWSTFGDRSADVRATFGGPLHVLDAATGGITSGWASAIPVGTAPVLIADDAALLE